MNKFVWVLLILLTGCAPPIPDKYKPLTPHHLYHEESMEKMDRLIGELEKINLNLINIKRGN